MSEASRLTRDEEIHRTQILEHISVSYYSSLDAVFDPRQDGGEGKVRHPAAVKQLKHRGPWRLQRRFTRL